jgi:hypothetical protein
MMFFKGAPSQDNFRGIHNFLKIPIVKVLFSNLPSKKGMSYVTYPMREIGKHFFMHEIGSQVEQVKIL